MADRNERVRFLARSGACPLWYACARVSEEIGALVEPRSSDPYAPGFMRVEVEVDGAGDPVDWLSHQCSRQPRLYFAHRDASICVAGVGAAETIRAARADDPQLWRRLSVDLRAPRARFYGAASVGARPIATVGHGRDGFEGCAFVLPMCELQVCDGVGYFACHLRWRGDLEEGEGVRISFGQAASDAREMLGQMSCSLEPIPRHVRHLPLLLGRSTTLSEEQWPLAAQEVREGRRGGAAGAVVCLRLHSHLPSHLPEHLN